MATIIKFNQALGDLLDLATDKPTWLSDLIDALGLIRTITIKNYAAATPATTHEEAWTLGTVVWESKLIKAIKPVDNEIRSFGKFYDVTARQAADISVGKTVVQISGNSNWLQFLAGPKNGDLEIKLPNWNSKSGFAFGPQFAIRPPENLPESSSGVDPTMPYRWELDWIEGDTVVETQVIYLDNPQQPIVFQYEPLFRNLGEVPYFQSTQSFVFGDGGYKCEFGIHAAKLPASVYEEGDEPGWQTMVVPGPKDRWTDFPSGNGYDIAFDSTFPRACRIRIYTPTGAEFRIMQNKRDQTPINDRRVIDGVPVMGQTRSLTSRWRPFFNIAQWAFDDSRMRKISPDAWKFYAGTRPEWNRSKQGRERLASNAAIPVFSTGSSQVNGYLHILAMPEWAANTSLADWNLEPHTGPMADRFFPWSSGNTPGGATSSSTYPTSPTGWRKDSYGDFSTGHDPWIGRGGQRFDRRSKPAQLGYLMTDTDGYRPQGQVPWKVIWDEYAKGYFSICDKHVLNPKTLEQLPIDEVTAGMWGYLEGYYNGHLNYPDKNRWIRMHGMGTNQVWRSTDFDRDGLHQWNGSQFDNQHMYPAPGIDCLVRNSVFHAFAQKQRWFSMWMSWTRSPLTAAGSNMGKIGNIESTEPDMKLFLRHHAWRLSQTMWTWITGADHPQLVPQAKTEEVLVLELESLYDNTVVPMNDPAHPDHNHYVYQGLRNLGVVIQRLKNTVHRYSCLDDDKRFYFFQQLVEWKITGLFARMHAKNAKCAGALDWMVQMYAKCGPERMVATKGRQENRWVTNSRPIAEPLVMPANWFEVAANMQPQDSSDMVRNADGTPYFTTDGNNQRERWAYQHDLQQCCYDMKLHFSEYNLPYVDQAVAMLDEMEAFVAQDYLKNFRDYRFRYITQGPTLINLD